MPMRLHHPLRSSRLRDGKRSGRGRIESLSIAQFRLWPLMAEYTARLLTYGSDILNAILGIMQAFTEREPAAYHLCGVPVQSRGQSSLQEFVKGLCWRLSDPHTLNGARAGAGQVGKGW
ncbi:1-alkyl-2-acetylglycerophosphocholine esterase [Fusarium albosuccineum]|uniref:1-alkyl-2-acetylglycerophosphocholine esterase n=1 Tax=Fusarium albosuccineum TaxID=1237068 RepID=A0A8H4P2E0_9HYPO|nr:1-alkyl-2-acetylglycerophosphocholine esterase [Fusarium albosuccineum]